MLNIYNFSAQWNRSPSETNCTRRHEHAAEEGHESDCTNGSGLSDSDRSSVYRISIPGGVKPGDEFSASVGGRVVRVRCPVASRPGQHLQITVPIDNDINRSPPPTPPDSDNVTQIPDQNLLPGEQSAYHVKIPEGVRGGQQFPVTIGGQHLYVTCPNMGRPGHLVRISPPSSRRRNANALTSLEGQVPPPPLLDTDDRRGKTRRFEVQVPKGVTPGKPFALMAGGVRVLVTCPRNASSGQRIQFDLPLGLTASGPKSKLAKIKLSYDKDGWTRTVRATDMKFQWTRLDERGNVDQRKRFDMDRSAYVLKLEYSDNDRSRLRPGRVSFVTPEKGTVASSIKCSNGNELASYSDIASAQMKCYSEKITWFRETCNRLRVGWDEGYIKMNIRRDHLVVDSMHAVLKLPREDLRKGWRFHFVGESGLDVGGLKTEWFEVVTKEMFNPDRGLWQSSATNQMCMQINPASEMCCPDEHLLCFRFIGRVMGKALLDGELVRGHMVKHLYKHILGWPVMFSDLEDIDEECFERLKGLKDMGADVEYVGVDFTFTEDLLGMKETVELIEGGADVELKEDNLPEYLEARLRHHLLGRYEAQVNELLLGFYDVLPEPLLTIFDFQELELLMCGLPEIEMEDWMENTDYTGEFIREGPSHEVCVWFWDIVGGYDQEMKARLLQFVTGTSGVPANGFGSLQGPDGELRNFSIEGVTLDTCVYPRSHTCFNRLDLPLYETRDQLEEKLRIAVTMASTGFDLE